MSFDYKEQTDTNLQDSAASTVNAAAGAVDDTADAVNEAAGAAADTAQDMVDDAVASDEIDVVDQGAEAGQKKAETRIAKGNFRDTIRAVAGGYVAYLGIKIIRELEPIDRTPSKLLMPFFFIIFGGIVCFISLKSYMKTAKAISNGTYDEVDEQGNPVAAQPVPVQKEKAPLAKTSSSIADRAKAAAAYAAVDDGDGEDTGYADTVSSDADMKSSDEGDWHVEWDDKQ